MSTMNIYDMADTWNDGATTFSAIKMNVTDTASASGSLLMDLQVGGVSRFRVGKGGTGSTNTVISTGAGGIALSSFTGVTGLNNQVGAITGALSIAANGAIQFTNALNNWQGATPDIILTRDAANTLAQRNGVNAQAFRVYNTFTDASNYERAFMKWNSNVLEIGTEAAGTGSGRELALRSATQSVNFDGNGLIWNTSGRGVGMGRAAPGAYNTIASGGNVDLWHNSADSVGIREASGFTNGAKLVFRGSANAFRVGLRGLTQDVLDLQGATNGAALSFQEMTAPAAPAANGVRISAEDDGTGKTRLMALFATGVAQQIAIEP